MVAPEDWAKSGAPRSAPRFAATLDELRHAVTTVALADPRTKQIEPAGEGGCLQFEARSRRLGLPDIVSVHLVEAADAKVSLAIYSRARYGLYDLGVNRRRVRRWMRALEARLPA